MLNPRLTFLAAAALMCFGLAGTGALAAAEPDRAGGVKPGVVRGGILHIDPDYPFRLELSSRPVAPSPQPAERKPASRFRLLSHEPQIGELRNWAGLDLVHGAIYPKTFALRGVGSKVEVWVATGRRTFAGASSVGTDYQDGDCRNGQRTTLDDAQVRALIRAFDGTIYPRESAVFSVPPDRDGANAAVGPPAFHPQGPGDRTVVLVDNIRDPSFFDLNNAHGFGYAVGIYSSAVEDLFDRHVMTIDGFDWLHRTGVQPPDEPVDGDNCRNAPAYPNLIEGVFAHEYQHLLERYEDSDEVDWVDEGLAEWARTLTGYADPSIAAPAVGADLHIQCFLGNLSGPSGPENSLTVWGDGADIDCDYGAAYTLMEYLHGRFGKRFMTALHRSDANGLAGLQEALGRRADAQAVLHDWAAMVALDHAFGKHEDPLFTTPTLDAAVNWDSPYAFSSPGAPPNGSDYVRLRDSNGAYLDARDLRRLTFDGASTIPGRPVEWTVDSAPPGGGPSALYTGAGNNLDRSIVRPLAVPASGAELAFQAEWNVEEDPSGGWDFTFVQVSTDGGATYRSIQCTSSRSDASPHARPVMHDNLPGYTAYSGGWRTERCSLDAFTGRSVLVAFRHVTDGSVSGDPDDPSATIPPGFWLRNVTLGGASVADGSTLAGWLSPSQARPTLVHGFTLQLVAYASRGRGPVSHARIPLDARHDAVLDWKELHKLLRSNADVVGAIVMYDEPTERFTDYAPYLLTVNGVLQPGG